MGTKGTWKRKPKISREAEERNWRLLTGNATQEDREWLESQRKENTDENKKED